MNSFAVGDDEPPVVVTTTAAAPGSSVAGVVTVIVVGDTTTGVMPSTPPKVTVAPVMNPEPVIVTGVPPTVGPDACESTVTVGCDATNVYVPVAVPPGAVTVTVTAPGTTVAGDVTVIVVGEVTTGVMPSRSPNRTVVPVMNPEPVIVIDVPPAVPPDAGETELTVGCGAV